MSNTKIMRDSNMELLRIVAMLLVLVVHADFASLGAPTKVEVMNNPYLSIVRLGVESISIISVNVFVLLSGWYGIKMKRKGLIGLLFQSMFFGILGVFLCNSLSLFNAFLGINFWGITSSPASAFFSIMMINFEDYWFVKSYVLLYILSPILNAYVNQSSHKQFKTTLILFFIFQFLWGWYYGSVGFFSNGYSTMSFIGLYLLARYIRIYQPSFAKYYKSLDVLAYIVLIIISTTLAFVGISQGWNQLYDATYKYNSPLVIAASMAFLLFFSKIRFQSSIVNTIASSAFAVYLLHTQSQMYTVYTKTIRRWFETENNYYFLLNTIILLFAVFVLAVLIDKIRIYLWDKIAEAIFIEKM